jgi:hypothetical protein
LYENGIPITLASSIADHFNNFFINISDSIGNRTSGRTGTPHVESDRHIEFNFICPKVTEDEVDLIISNLKSSNAKDVYDMSNNFIKFHKNALRSNITSLINKNMFSGQFPDCLKLGIVTPIFKDGDKKNKSNYRPITINPIIAKIFEYVLYRRLNDHLELNNILHTNQFGFVRHSNTETATIHILHDIYRNIDNRMAVSLTCIDLSKAFDCIQIDILINKIKKLQLTKPFLNSIISYLENRKQAVKISNELSSFKTVLGGTPQGGILSGDFFDLYINSIFDLDLSGTLILYCDDISLINTGRNATELKLNIESDLKKISDWLDLHFLSPNISKTKYLCFHNKKKMRTLPKLH